MTRAKLALLLAVVVLAVWLGWKGASLMIDALKQWQPIVLRESQATGVPAAWINAVILTESSGNANAYRAEPQIRDASYGLMQLLERTAKGLGYAGTPDGLYDPQTNIHYGVKLLAQLRARNGDDFARVYSAYNSGDPNKYKVSSQVAKNVNRALQNLSKVSVA